MPPFPSSGLPALTLPPLPAGRVRRDAATGQLFILDPLRRQWLVLTPEEWVRQHFTHWLISTLGYPPGLMANEVGLRLNTTLRRCDTVVYDHSGSPLAIVEYKAPTIPLTARVLAQVVRYNIVLRTPCLMMSNGMTHRCLLVNPDTGQSRFLERFPPHPWLEELNIHGLSDVFST